ncbi:MAG: lactate racemase domain-containing protein [Planctomycetota bacterium]
MSGSSALPKFFAVRQKFERPRVGNVANEVVGQLESVCRKPIAGKSIAITAGSRGVANIAEITKACVDFLKRREAKPFIVPAMGSHGGATSQGQREVLASFGITEDQMGCPIRSSMEVCKVCDAAEGFPVYFDQFAFEADHVLVVNRIKPHTRFAGDIESGLMKMMLIGLGKQKGAEVYHRVIHNYSFDQIVRSVANEVVERCSILAGVGIMENAYEETAEIRVVAPEEIENREPEMLRLVKRWMPALPFDQAELLIVDRIGKNISGTGMDTNVIGRKRNDHAAIEGERQDIHHIYVRDLTDETHGNASGIGLAEMCHRRVLEKMDQEYTRMNCITAGHITGAMVPLAFESDHAALEVACKLAGYVEPKDVTAMWIPDTLHLEKVVCSEAYWQMAKERELETLSEPTSLEFDAQGDLAAFP